MQEGHMIRHMVIAATMAAGLSAAAFAAERATFVLTDGSRQSGEIAFHGSGNRNIIDNYLNLAVPGSPDKTFPKDQVAMIDFDGGQPVPAEFQQLPASGGNLIVLRNGQMQRGELVNLINGDTVQWQNEAGQTQQYAVRDVSRIYLNPDAARRIYPQVASAAQSQQTPTTGTIDNPPSGGLRIPANQQWVPTGIMVRKGQRVAFSASGQVHFSQEQAHVAGPDGNPSVQVSGLPVREMSVGGLIGRVGNSQPFPIGANRQPIVMPEAGLLMLGVNDTNVSDNSGEFVVSLQNAGR
jgi:hypothetical protein